MFGLFVHLRPAGRKRGGALKSSPPRDDDGRRSFAGLHSCAGEERRREIVVRSCASHAEKRSGLASLPPASRISPIRSSFERRCCCSRTTEHSEEICT